MRVESVDCENQHGGMSFVLMLLRKLSKGVGFFEKVSKDI
jgi:hypothetical protein